MAICAPVVGLPWEGELSSSKEALADLCALARAGGSPGHPGEGEMQGDGEMQVRFKVKGDQTGVDRDILDNGFQRSTFISAEDKDFSEIEVLARKLGLLN